MSRRPADIASDPRARHLLRALVSRHIHDGEPVGSQTLARHAGLDVSAATIRNILDFPKEFSPRPADVITLDRNYRSTQPILAAANGVIELARERYTKNLWTDRASEQRPMLITVKDEIDQAAYMAQSARSCDFGQVEERMLNVRAYQDRSSPPISWISTSMEHL